MKKMNKKKLIVIGVVLVCAVVVLAPVFYSIDPPILPSLANVLRNL